MMKSGAMIGIGVGSRAMFEDMNRALEVNKIKPVVDKVFPFDKAAERSAARPRAISSARS